MFPSTLVTLFKWTRSLSSLLVSSAISLPPLMSVPDLPSPTPINPTPQPTAVISLISSLKWLHLPLREFRLITAVNSPNISSSCCQENGLVHFFNYPKHPQSNGYLERFNRTIQEQFVNWHIDDLDEPEDFNRKLMEYLIWYNTEKPHRGIGNLPPLRYYLDNFITPLKSPICYGRLQ